MRPAQDGQGQTGDGSQGGRGLPGPPWAASAEQLDSHPPVGHCEAPGRPLY